MISYKKRTLSNGLTILAHQDKSSAMAAVNMLYQVGARNENPSRTGFAHLFEHLMFRGTKRVSNFDIPVQMACGENNAFTNNDYTDFYITLPKDNIETALFLEGDRMNGLNITEQTLEAEKKVVIEEYNQRYLNQPYGQLWLKLRALAYREHPYRWATIGLTPDHIAGASLSEVKDFYQKFYNPSNAILSIATNLETEHSMDLAQKYFESIPINIYNKENIPTEPTQTEPRIEIVEKDVPATMYTVAYKMGDRRSDDFYICDIISDILSGGTSSRLYRELVQERKLFANVNAYITGDVDPGLFVITAQLSEGVSPEQAKETIEEQLDKIKYTAIDSYELEKVKNKFEAETTFGELNIMNKAMNLGFYQMLGDLELINREIQIFRSISPEQIMSLAKKIFTPNNSSTLIFGKNVK
ncbi:MAG: pitrilysin family protein [Rikenellaceae bacterium]